jgi:hypothetical protein
MIKVILKPIFLVIIPPKKPVKPTKYTCYYGFLKETVYSYCVCVIVPDTSPCP